jgi:hypothetical protein
MGVLAQDRERSYRRSRSVAIVRGGRGLARLQGDQGIGRHLLLLRIQLLVMLVFGPQGRDYGPNDLARKLQESAGAKDERERESRNE